jgi:hypothetical protein
MEKAKRRTTEEWLIANALSSGANVWEKSRGCLVLGSSVIEGGIAAASVTVFVK